MNAFNRFLVILGALAVAFFWLGAIFIILVLPEQLLLALRDTAFAIRNNTLLVQVFVTAFGVSAILVALLILAGEIAPRQPTAVRINHVSTGSAVISIDAMVQQLRGAIEAVPLVSMARPRLTVRKGAVDVVVELRTSAQAQLRTVADDVCAVVRRVVEGEIGAELRSVRVAFQQTGRGGGAHAGTTGPITMAHVTPEGAPPAGDSLGGNERPSTHP